MEKRYIRTADVASYTGLSIHTIKKYVLDKRIPFIKANGCVMFSLEDIDAWLESCKVTPLTDRKVRG